MAQETRRVPAFLSGPTTATAVLLPMRIYVGWWWLMLGVEKLNAGWLSLTREALPSALHELDPPYWFAASFVAAAQEHAILFQLLIVIGELLFGAMMMTGLMVRVAGGALALMAGLAFLARGFPFDSWIVPMGVMALTLAVAAAGRYLGLDAIMRARYVKVPLF